MDFAGCFPSAYKRLDREFWQLTRSAQDFLGDWRVSRRINDNKAQSVALFDGQATIGPTGSGWLYHETGTLKLAQGATLHAERRYLWQPDEGGIDIFFDDGRFFHRVELAQGGQKPSAAHWCDPDQYEVSYDFSDWPNWTSTWHVRGPRKDYEMTSDYITKA